MKTTSTNTDKPTERKKKSAGKNITLSTVDKINTPKKTKTQTSRHASTSRSNTQRTASKSVRGKKPAASRRRRKSTKKTAPWIHAVLAGMAVGCLMMFCIFIFAVPAIKGALNTDSESADGSAHEKIAESAGKINATAKAGTSKQESSSRSESGAAGTKKTDTIQNTNTVKTDAQNDAPRTTNKNNAGGVAANEDGEATKQTAKTQTSSQIAQTLPATKAQTSITAKQSSNTTVAQKNEIASARPDKTTPPQQTTSDDNALAATIPQAVNAAKLVFVFDDGGQNMSQLEKFVTLPFPITVAVLPRIAHSAEAARRVRSSGNEVMLHQPMQAININVNPGPGAILPDMSLDEVEKTLKANMAEVGPVAGVNNHEGSLISEDEFKMSVVLKTVRETGGFFLDSRTTSQSRVPQAAMNLGSGYYARNVFLDNTKKREDILTEIRKGLSIANKNGAAIMIGHVWSADVLPQILLELYPILKSKGYTFSTVSKSGAMIVP